MATPASSKPKQQVLAFIVSSSREKPDPHARRVIRRHVMRGKNRRNRAAEAPKSGSWINQNSVCSEHLQLSSASASGPYFPLSKQIGSDLPLTQFAYDMPPYALDLIFKFFTVLGQAMYPIELCLMFDLKKLFLVEYLAVDPLYCHSVLWMTQAYFDWLRGDEHSSIEIHHAHQTLKMLQQRLDDSQLATSDATICVVLSLVNMTALVGDQKSSRKHMMGLYRMVEMRGGVRAFTENSQIQLKICRADLTIAMLTSSKPMFFSHGISWESYISTGQKNSQNFLPKPFAKIHVKLGCIWADLQEFTKSANLAFQTGQKMDCVLFQEILVSIQYRLLLIDVTFDSLDKAFYTGILAFSTNIFLQMQGLALQFEVLSARLQDAILGLQSLEDESLVEFKIWLLFVARMTTVSEKDKDSWLDLQMLEAMGALDLTSWETVRGKLKAYLWIDLLHDKRGGRAFDHAINYSPKLHKC